MRRIAYCLLLSCGLVGCTSDEAPPSPPCGQQCRDGNAVRALRETMKLAYNLTLQTNPVGDQDETTPCPLGGNARVFGVATSDPMQGATLVDLTYEFDACGYIELDEEPEENYDLVITGTLTQEGIIAVQPSATSALLIASDAVTLSGTVYDPPIAYEEVDCPVELGQSGNQVSGTICGRNAGAEL